MEPTMEVCVECDGVGECDWCDSTGVVEVDDDGPMPKQKDFDVVVTFVGGHQATYPNIVAYGLLDGGALYYLGGKDDFHAYIGTRNVLSIELTGDE